MAERYAVDPIEHLPLVKWVANRNRTQFAGSEFEDLVGDGTVGLLKAAEGFDPGRGFKFSTFAAKTVWGYMKTGHNRRMGIAPQTGKRREPETVSLETPIAEGLTLSDLVAHTEEASDAIDRAIDCADGARAMPLLSRLPADLRVVVPMLFREQGDRTVDRLCRETGLSRQSLYLRERRLVALLRERMDRGWRPDDEPATTAALPSAPQKTAVEQARNAYQRALQRRRQVAS